MTGYFKGEDFEIPDWDDCQKVHDWKNYVTKEVRDLWSSFSLEQRKALASNFSDQADLEEWD